MATTGRALRLEQQLRRQLAKVTDQQVRDLVKAWATAWDEVSTDLEDILVEILASGNVTSSQMLKSKRLAKALAQIAATLQDLARAAGVRITADLAKVADEAGAAQAAMIATQLPKRQNLVDLDEWTRVDQRQVSAIVKRSTQQITASTRALSPSATRAVRRELIRGVVSGSNPRQTARRIVQRTHGAFNGGLTRALTIARTETLDAHREAARLGQEQHADVLAGWIWLATVGPRTCPACWGMHGTMHDLDEAGPHGHQCCRCARLPVVKPWSELGFTGIDEPPPAVIDADAAFARLDPLQQQAILGRAGYQAWVAGKFPRSKWAKRQKNPGWRDSYVPAKPPKIKAVKPSRPSGPVPARSKGTTTPPPASPPAGGPPDDAGDGTPPVPQPPAMGRTVGTTAQQDYTKTSALPKRAQRTPSADNFYTFVTDDEDRTTALLQYLKPTEDLVKSRARQLEAGDPFSASDESAMRSLIGQMNGSPVTGIGSGNYLLDDLRADITGAAYRLLARRAHAEDLGVVYKGIGMPGFFDLDDPDEQQRLFDLITTSDWWFTSATPDRDIAELYAENTFAPHQVILVIVDARGIRLDSMGRMAEAPEVLLNGGVRDPQYHVDEDGVMWIYGRWQA